MDERISKLPCGGEGKQVVVGQRIFKVSETAEVAKFAEDDEKLDGGRKIEATELNEKNKIPRILLLPQGRLTLTSPSNLPPLEITHRYVSQICEKSILLTFERRISSVLESVEGTEKD